jgi:ribosomal protein S18 acetylase RimI-like enzyme
MMTWMIRELRPEDCKAALSLWQSLPGLGLSSADEAENIAFFLGKNPGLSFAAMDGVELIGTILGGSDGRRGYIYHLAVHPLVQKKGIGRALVDRCLSAMRKSGLQKCHLFVYANNKSGIQFWKKIGWTFREEIRVMSIDGF